MEAMQKTNKHLARYFADGKLMSLVVALVVTAVLAVAAGQLVHPEFAYAQVGATFVASSGTTADQPVDIGVELTFAVVSDPADGSPGTVQVGNGVTAALDTSYGGAVVVPERVEHDGAIYEVIRCATSSFQASKLTAVTLPSTIQRINSYSFYCCYNLASLDFSGEPHLAYIEGHAFEAPTGNGVLAKMQFPASLRSVGAYSFFGQSALTDLTFESESLERIARYAFANCAGLKTVHVPRLTAAAESFGAYCFTGCTSLEFVEFRGDVASFPDELIGTRYFDDCPNIATVVYRGKKIIPSWKRYGSSTDLAYEFTASNPTLYYTITYYGSQADAEAGADAIGAVCVRSDTRLCDIVPGMARVDDSGAIVFDGDPVAPPAGSDAWCYEGDPTATDAPTDSLYAYPVRAGDMASASVVLDAAVYPYTGLAVAPAPVVYDANGVALEQGRDYTLIYQRKQGEDAWVDDAECIAVGEMRVVAKGAGDYAGEMAALYTIAHREEGETFESGGITYRVTTSTDGTFVGEVSVGDGKNSAVPLDTVGEISIPATIQPEGSLVSYQVTAISAYAFGSMGADTSCAQITGVTLPEGVATIGTCAFAFCSKLASVTVPATVKSIGARAFQNCIKLSSLVFEGDEVEVFGTYSFAFCTSLSQVALPSAKVFRDHVFGSCTRLARVDFLGVIEEGDDTQFADCERLARVVFHFPQQWAGSFPASTPSFYGVATFKDSAGTVVGEAVLKLGTPVESITPDIESSYLLEGSVPAVPAGCVRWRLADSEVPTFEASCDMVPVLRSDSPDEPGSPDDPDPSGAKGLEDGKTAVAGSGASKAQYKVISNESNTVSFIRSKATGKKATVPAKVKLNGRSYTVTVVGKSAFKGTKVKQVTVKSKSITSFSRAFASSKVSKVVAPKAKKKAYGKLLTKKACGRAVKVMWK